MSFPTRSRWASLRRRSVALLAGLGLAVAGLSAAPAFAGAASEAGYVDHNYGEITDDVSAHTSQSKVWFHDGAWWAVMMEPAATTPVPHENRWAIYRLDRASQTWQSTGVQVDERNQSHPDVLSVGNTLWVVSSYSRSDTGPVKVYRFDYDTNSDSYALHELFRDSHPKGNGRFDDGIPTPASGVQYATIAQLGTKLVIGYTSNNNVWWMSSDDGVTWTPPAAIASGARAPISGPPGPATSSSDDIAVVVGFGSGQGGIVWSRTSTNIGDFGGFFFAPWTGAGFGGIEDAWAGSDVGDNHISVKADGGRVLIAVKTSLKGTDDPLVSLLARGAAGGWSQHTVLTRRAGGVRRDATRPVLAVDSGEAHVLMTDAVNGGAVYRNSAPLGTLAFNNDLGAAFIKDATNVNVNDATTSKQQLAASTGIIGLASDDVKNNYLHGCTGGSCQSGPLAPPPAPAIATSTSLTSTPNPSVAGGPVTLRATVSAAGGGAIGGAVSFLDGSTTIKTVALDRNVAATITAFSAGSHSLRAVYLGNSTFQTSTSSVLTQRVSAGSTAGSGPDAQAPAGARLSLVSPAARMVSGKKLGGGKSKTFDIKAPGGARAAALNVTVRGGAKDTRVAVCPGSTTKDACKSQTLMRVAKRTYASKLAITDLSGPRIRIYNQSGKVKVWVDVQGWYVNDASKLRLSPLAAAQRVVKNATVTTRSIKLTIPKSLRPAGTRALQLNIMAKKPSRDSAFSACRKNQSRAACLARPTLFADAGKKVRNQVIVPVPRNGKIRLVNQTGSVKVTVHVAGVFLAD